MTIRVEIEGKGVVAEFPDGTPQDVIDAAVKRDFFSGAPTAGTTVPNSGPTEKPTRPMHGAMLDIAEGAGKKILETGQNIYRGVANVVQGRPADTPRSPDFEAAVQPANKAERSGGIAAEIGAFLIGDKGASKLVRGTSILAQGTRAGVAGIAGGSVTKATGGTDEEAGVNAAIGGFAPLVIKGLGAVSGKLGRKIQSTIIRPSLQDVRDGFKIETVTKYDLGGSMETMAGKTHEAIVQRAATLSDELKAANAQGAQVDALQAIADAQASVLGNRAATFGKNAKVKEAFDQLLDELTEIAPDGKVDLLTAQQLKRATGQLGAWKYGKGDPESNAMEIAANALYSRLKTSIEAAAPNARIRAINAEIGELIPVENAIIKRIPVEQRNNVLSLADIVSIAHSPELFLATKAAKSGTLANAAVKAEAPIRGAARPVTAAAQATVTNQ